MPAATHRRHSLGPAVVSALILLVPAFWNRFPLLEYDTGGYLARWFEGTLVPSRSTVYGLLLAAGSLDDFWFVVILQAAAAVWIIGVMVKVHGFNTQPAGLPAVVGVLAVTTALPWLASELLTDIFAGLGVLALHALVWHGHGLTRRRRAALVAFIAFAAATHSATYAVLAVLAIAALILWLFDRTRPRGAAAAQAAAAMVLGAALLLAGNYVVAKRIAWTPGGYGIAFARMLQDGIVTRYLDDHCPRERLKLCPYREQLPLDADAFLWEGGVFDRLGRFTGLGDEMRRIVLESLRDYPAMQLKAALAATAKQLVAVGTGEGVVKDMWHTDWAIAHFTPWAAPAMDAARQQHDEFGFAAVNAVHRPLAWVAMALLPLTALLAFYRAAFADLGRLSATVALALLANAAVCGIISNPHDRYGSRIAWTAVFAAALVGWRWLALTRMAAARSTAEVFR
jgi:hypothetical protein